ncbi:MAG: NAD(P)/FAD-dependent oxidoreductase [Alphaproteobacteria bacterium]|nr:NAD(P)/FAD-dependent oxidoreductase [Alphaproteobacteria bacterium]
MQAIIIGAGPAGLTAAYELLKRSDIKPIVIEQNDFVGGISTSREYKGNIADFGGHRFFTKQKRVFDLWKEILPIQTKPAMDDILLNRKNVFLKKKKIIDPEKQDNCFLYRKRLSRIYYNQKFFDYPITLSLNTILGLGIFRMGKIFLSYLKSCVFKRPDTNLENFFINRFGSELYQTFFKEYTEKLWGVPCSQISAEWGAQRVKGVSILKIIKEFFHHDKKETSLIDAFYYPKLGCGQMYSEMAKRILEMGGEIWLNTSVEKINLSKGKIKNIIIKKQDGSLHELTSEYIFSSCPIRTLIRLMGEKVPQDVKEIAKNLVYRDFKTVLVLANQLKIKNKTKFKTINNLVPDCWIYIQEKNVHMGRVQVFNNWSPYLVKDFKNTVWLGLEYFYQKGDALDHINDTDFIQMAIDEAEKIGLIEKKDILETAIYTVPKAYPAYFGSYDRFEEIKAFLKTISNLYPIGRNGMHHYNNMDHSILTAMVSVDNILGKKYQDVWLINTEKKYNENA